MRFDRGVAEITPHSTHMLMRKKFNIKTLITHSTLIVLAPGPLRETASLTIAKAQAIIPHPGFRGLLAKGAHPHGGPKRCSQSKPRPSQLQLQLGHRRRPKPETAEPSSRCHLVRRHGVRARGRARLGPQGCGMPGCGIPDELRLKRYPCPSLLVRGYPPSALVSA